MPLQQRRWGGVTAGTAEVVITTKLFRPGLRQQTVERKRLYDLLREGRTLPLTLVVAPAGWGKSTIVADWLARDDVTAGWVSLDGGDNDPKRFWRYLLLAAGQAGSAAGAAALRRLDAAGSDVLRDVLPAFVNELASAEAPLVLVLDDYHLVTSAQVHATVATLLDRCPPQLHLMLITRADPPLPLSRLRVRGDLAELRADDLRFSAAEAVEFFSSRLGTLLSEQDVLRLLARTEGWAAGLQLAALRLRDRPDRSDFIERLTGADWHIVNYLGEEVLATQPAEVRDFLLATSVLNRMCAPLCDALTGRADGAGLISEIYRANLFLVPLDDEHRWFRYHHLFGGLLRHELARTAPDRPPVLHRRAARWYADHGDAAEAIGHAIASGDGSLSGRLVAANWRQPFNAGQLETVRMWLDALPAELVSRRRVPVGGAGMGGPRHGTARGSRRRARRRRDLGSAGRSAHGAARAAAVQGRGRGRSGGPAAGDLAERRRPVHRHRAPAGPGHLLDVAGGHRPGRGTAGRGGPAGRSRRQPAGLHLRRGIPGPAGGEPGRPERWRTRSCPTRSRRWARR